MNSRLNALTGASQVFSGASPVVILAISETSILSPFIGQLSKPLAAYSDSIQKSDKNK